MPSNMLRALLFVAVTLPVLTPDPVSAADTTVVNQVGFTFQPSVVTIQVGDAVRWVRASGIHTITSGTGFADPNVAFFFDEPFDFVDPEFIYTFEDTAGTYPYFCRPHEVLGMKGTVIVEKTDVGVPLSSRFERIEWGALKKIFAE